MKTTVGRAKQDFGVLGLSIPFIKKGEELLVEQVDDNNFRIISGILRGVMLHRDDLDFDLI